MYACSMMLCADLSGAIAAFREAMGEREISRQPIVYLELATFYMYSGAYQVFPFESFRLLNCFVMNVR